MKEILKNGLARLGIDDSDTVIARFVQYYELLVSYNEKVNLTAITAPHEVAVKHFLDSVSLLGLYELPYGARVIDVGTGAGFPGLPAQNCARGHSPDAGGRAGETRRFLGRMQQYAWPYTGRLYSRARRGACQKGSTPGSVRYCGVARSCEFGDS